MSILEQRKIVFFDGHCGLCNRSVNWLLSHDKLHKLLFAPLQGATAEALLTATEKEDLKTIIYYKQGKKYIRSAAVIRCVTGLGGIWKISMVLLLVPSFIRDYVYNYVARNRYRWFGQSDICRIPSKSEKDYFLP